MLHVQDLKAKYNGLTTQFCNIKFQSVCSMSLSPFLWLPSSLVQSVGIPAVPLLVYSV